MVGDVSKIYFHNVAFLYPLFRLSLNNFKKFHVVRIYPFFILLIDAFWVLFLKNVFYLEIVRIFYVMIKMNWFWCAWNKVEVYFFLFFQYECSSLISSKDHLALPALHHCLCYKSGTPRHLSLFLFCCTWFFCLRQEHTLISIVLG